MRLLSCAFQPRDRLWLAAGVPEHGTSRTAHQPPLLPSHSSSAAAAVSGQARSDSHKLAARAYREKKEREHFKAEKKAHSSERERRPAPRPPVKQEPGAAGDAHKPRQDALHKPSSVSDVRDLLKEVDARHSLLHSLEHPAQRGTEPPRQPHSRPHPGHARPHPSAPPPAAASAATADKPPHSRSGQESAGGHLARHPSSQRHRAEGDSAHKSGHHRRSAPPAAAGSGALPPTPSKAPKVERPPPPPPVISSVPIKQEKARSPSRLDHPNGVSLPTAPPPPPVRDPLSASLTLAQVKDEYMPAPIISPLRSPLFSTTSPDLSDALQPSSEPEPSLASIVPKMESKLSPLFFTESSPPAPPPPPPPAPAPPPMKVEPKTPHFSMASALGGSSRATKTKRARDGSWKGPTAEACRLQRWVGSLTTPGLSPLLRTLALVSQGLTLSPGDGCCQVAAGRATERLASISRCSRAASPHPAG